MTFDINAKLNQFKEDREIYQAHEKQYLESPTFKKICLDFQRIVHFLAADVKTGLSNPSSRLTVMTSILQGDAFSRLTQPGDFTKECVMGLKHTLGTSRGIAVNVECERGTRGSEKYYLTARVDPYVFLNPYFKGINGFKEDIFKAMVIAGWNRFCKVNMPFTTEIRIDDSVDDDIELGESNELDYIHLYLPAYNLVFEDYEDGFEGILAASGLTFPGWHVYIYERALSDGREFQYLVLTQSPSNTKETE